MSEYYWDDKIEYLRKTRDLYYNDDYLQFLVHTVWKINEPVNMIDFGCGFGYLGLKLLPLLPEGSTYTGVDKGIELIKTAKERFANQTYSTEFIIGDMEEIRVDRKYDIAMCHAFLLHMSNPKKVLQKMIDCVENKGKVICFEPHWISSMSNCSLDAVEQSKVVPLGNLQTLYENDYKRSGRDGNIGCKLPVYFTQLGLKNVECRVSDKVNFLHPTMSLPDRQALYDSLRAEGLGELPGKEEEFIRNLMNRGFTCNEAREQYEAELLFSKEFNDDSFLTSAPNMKLHLEHLKRADRVATRVKCLVVDSAQPLDGYIGEVMKYINE
jgi:SAM-dependent methyltransferase